MKDKILKKLLEMIPWENVIEFAWENAKDYLAKKVADSESKIDDAAFKYAELIIEEVIADFKDDGMINGSVTNK